MKKILAVLATALTMLIPTMVPVQAVTPPSPAPVAQHPRPDVISHGVVVLNRSGRAFSTGTWGTSSASGCGYAWVRHKHFTLLGATAWDFTTYLDWCWNRARHVDYHVAWHLRVNYVGSQEQFHGVVNDYPYFYPWVRGSKYSGFHYYSVVWFENCIYFGCVSSDYARQELLVHSNGTAAWATDGDAS